VDWPPRAGGLPPEEIIFGRSVAMISIRQKCRRCWQPTVPILIQGENGTGKGLLAQYIHSRSALCFRCACKSDCAAIPGALLESELFGYEKGSFTDAHTSKPGYVEMAHRGTLFLDEIADLDLSLQAKVLQFLQDGHFSRIGDKQERRAETRVICATNRDLQTEIEAGRFRRDLFYRINVISINLPSLRERREDVALLADYFLGQLNARFERDAPSFTEENIESLSCREWRGKTFANWRMWSRGTRFLVRSILLRRSGCRDFLRNSIAEWLLMAPIPLKRIAKQAVREMEGEPDTQCAA